MRLPPGARKLRLTSTRTEPSLGPHTKRIHRAHLLGIFFSPYCTYLVLHERHGPVVELLPPGHKPLTLIFEPKMAGFLRHALYSIASSQ